MRKRDLPTLIRRDVRGVVRPNSGRRYRAHSRGRVGARRTGNVRTRLHRLRHQRCSCRTFSPSLTALVALSLESGGAFDHAIRRGELEVSVDGWYDDRCTASLESGWAQATVAINEDDVTYNTHLRDFARHARGVRWKDGVGICGRILQRDPHTAGVNDEAPDTYTLGVSTVCRK